MKEELDDILASLIPEAENYDNDYDIEPEPVVPAVENEAASYLGKKLGHKVGGTGRNKMSDEQRAKAHEMGLSNVGDNIAERKDIRDGWLEVDRELLGERNQFYPADWRFRIRPAEVEAIRNWSTIDDENINSVDTVFNEILKNCLAILTDNGPIGWGHINSWDRFFFILLIREYTFKTGESKIEFTEECAECGEEVTFNLNSLSLTYDMPDDDVLRHFDNETCTWFIDPEEFDLEGQTPITLYLPTLDKDANIKAWLIDRLQKKKKVDEVFLRFLPWIVKSVPKDLNIAQQVIRKGEMIYSSWDKDMFVFMDEVIRNIIVTPATYLKQSCPKCGEEVTATIRFQNGIKSIFAVQNKHRKFGKK